MSNPVDRLARTVRNLSETTDLRLKNLEAATAKLNELFSTLRVATLDDRLVETRVNGSNRHNVSSGP
jgi:hypothetical protein